MLAKGGEALSNSELLAILINNGSKNKSAVDLAKEILKLGHDNLNELGKLSLKDLQQVKGNWRCKGNYHCCCLRIGQKKAGRCYIG